MKRALTAVVVLALVLGWGVAGALAQQVAWDKAYGPLPKALSELTAGNGVYGLVESDSTIVAVDLTPTVNVSDTLTADGSPLADLAAGPGGTVFAINNTTVLTWTATAGNPVALQVQPKVPYVDGATLVGTFKHIAVGDGGGLFILFQATTGGAQYVLTGRYIKETMDVSIEPKSLNVVSKGNWVSCKIGLPAGHSEKDIDPSTVEIVGIAANGNSADEAIFIASGAPVSTDTRYLHVKFSRSELVSAVGDVLAGASKGKYSVTVTVRAQLKTSAGGEVFQGTAVFDAIIPKTKG